MNIESAIPLLRRLAILCGRDPAWVDATIARLNAMTPEEREAEADATLERYLAEKRANQGKGA